MREAPCFVHLSYEKLPTGGSVSYTHLDVYKRQLMPTCRECDIKMAIHMDDPPWDIFGLPRLLVDRCV